MDQFRFVDRWPSLTAFAEDLGITYGTAKGIRLRERLGATIPACYWRRAIIGARRRGIPGVTLRALARAAHRLGPKGRKGV